LISNDIARDSLVSGTTSPDLVGVVEIPVQLVFHIAEMFADQIVARKNLEHSGQ